MDSPSSVSRRIRTLVSLDGTKAVVNLLKGASANTAERALEALVRMATEQEGRGVMVQQGGLSACIEASVSEEKTTTDNPTKLACSALAGHCIAKILVTTNPTLLTTTQRLGAVKPLLNLCKNNDSTNLQQFEGLMSLTNLGSCDDETKCRIVDSGGLATVNYLMYSEHDMVRRAATECVGNLIPHEKALEYFRDPERVKVWFAFMRDFEGDFETARAAASGLAMACGDEKVVDGILDFTDDKNVKSGVKGLEEVLKSANIELMHRGLVMVQMMVGAKEGEETMLKVSERSEASERTSSLFKPCEYN